MERCIEAFVRLCDGQCGAIQCEYGDHRAGKTSSICLPYAVPFNSAQLLYLGEELSKLISYLRASSVLSKRKVTRKDGREAVKGNFDTLLCNQGVEPCEGMQDEFYSLVLGGSIGPNI